MTFWLKEGTNAVLVDGDGQPIDCPDCPCDETSATSSGSSSGTSSSGSSTSTSTSETSVSASDVTNECCDPLPSVLKLTVTGPESCMNVTVTLTHEPDFLDDCPSLSGNAYWVGTSHSGCIFWVLECGSGGSWHLWHIKDDKCDDINQAVPETGASCDPFELEFINGDADESLKNCGCDTVGQDYTATVTEV